MKKVALLIVALISFACNGPIEKDIEAGHDTRDVQIAQEKTKQIQYQWKIDSLKAQKK